MSEQRTSPEQRRALRARYTPEPVPTCQMCGKPMGTYGIPEGLVRAWLCDDGHADAYAETIARNVSLAGDPDVLAACDDADALAGARATAYRLRALLRRCEPVLATYQCADQQEGDALIALEADIAAELPEREGAGE